MTVVLPCTYMCILELSKYLKVVKIPWLCVTWVSCYLMTVVLPCTYMCILKLSKYLKIVLSPNDCHVTPHVYLKIVLLPDDCHVTPYVCVYITFVKIPDDCRVLDRRVTLWLPCCHVCICVYSDCRNAVWFVVYNVCCFMGWLRLVGPLQLQVSSQNIFSFVGLFCKRDL